MSEARKGKRFSEETRRKTSEAKIGVNHPNWGKIITKEIRCKISKALRGKNNPNYGKHKTEETERKMRLSAIKNLKSRFNQIRINYNAEACKVFNTINDFFGWSGKHAENGGEVHLKELGYWLDFYDRERNIVIEYYEKSHYRSLSVLTKTLLREQEIIKHLGCQFFRIDARDPLKLKMTIIKRAA